MYASILKLSSIYKLFKTTCYSLFIHLFVLMKFKSQATCAVTYTR